MNYRIKQGERIEHGIAMAQRVLWGNPWANIWVDCMGDCEPQQSFGLKFDSNTEVDAFTDAEMRALLTEHGWTHRGDEKGWLCPACSPRRAELDKRKDTT